MQTNAPRFPHRSPTPLPAWAVLFFAPQVGLLCVYHVVNGLFGMQPLSAALRWGTISGLLCLLLLAVPPLLKPLLGRGSTRQDWGIFAAFYGGAAIIAGSLRSLLTPWVVGADLPPMILLTLAGSMLVTLAISVAGMEALIARIVFQQTWQRESEHLQRALAESRSQLVMADDMLRREGAEYLHGEIQSRLIMAWAFLDHARTDPTQRHALTQLACTQLETLRHESLDHARLLLGLTDISLTKRLDDLIERFRTVLPLSVEVDPSIEELEARLDDKLRSAAQLMLEEGLLNAFRHAGASHVEVRLAPDPAGTLAIEIRDNGAGFDPHAHGRGLGLSGLGATLEAQGGFWKLDSAPGRGTAMTLILPLLALPERVPA